MTESGTRRRGAALESAIFQAVWDEVSEGGYTRLSIESVARRAGTGKAVLYRRWDGRVPLVLAAVQDNLPRQEDLADTGDLRDDLVKLLEAGAERVMTVGPRIIIGLLSEILDQEGVDGEHFALLNDTILKHLRSLLDVVYERAESRGELDRSAMSDQIATLPLDIVRSHVLMQRPVTKDFLAEIVDDIVMPVLRSRCAPGRR
ncbi:TetR/AcrR family transcriptional regulator [Salininema proteolyticum]|uniref:TetR/AcrR family transcriptional regulator n=1 Tax=Salininema proteolyticum TaxID=1607685 RepID=A0ABV8TYU0_9ACTN